MAEKAQALPIGASLDAALSGEQTLTWRLRVNEADQVPTPQTLIGQGPWPPIRQDVGGADRVNRVIEQARLQGGPKLVPDVGHMGEQGDGEAGPVNLMLGDHLVQQHAERTASIPVAIAQVPKPLRQLQAEQRAGRLSAM